MAAGPITAFRSAEYTAELETEPDGLSNVVLLRSRGVISVEGLVAAARLLPDLLQGGVANMVHDRRKAESFFDYAGLSRVYDTVLDVGFHRLNIVVVDEDPARPVMLRFTTEVGLLRGLAVTTLPVGSLSAAFAAMRKMLADAELQAPAPNLPSARESRPA